jgi:hypothetical protein
MQSNRSIAESIVNFARRFSSVHCEKRVFSVARKFVGEEIMRMEYVHLELFSISRSSIAVSVIALDNTSV